MTENQNTVNITRREVGQINLLTSNLHEISDKIKILKFEELQEELKFMQYERDGLNERLETSTKLQKELNNQLTSLKVREQSLLQKVEGFSEQMKEQAAQFQKTLDSFKQKEEEMKKVESRMEKIRSHLELYNAKCKANSKLLSEMFAQDEGMSNIIRNHIEINVKILEGRESRLENELAKISIYLEEFVKMIIFSKTRDNKILEQQESWGRDSKLIRRSNGQNEELLSHANENNNFIKEGVPPSFKLGNIKQIEENILYIRDKLEATYKVQALEKIESLKEKYSVLKKEKVESDNSIFILNNKLEQKEKEVKEKIHMLINNIHSVQKLAGKEIDTQAFSHESEEFSRFKFDQQFSQELEALQKLWQERTANEIVELNKRIDELNNSQAQKGLRQSVWLMNQSKILADNLPKDLLEKVEKDKAEQDQAIKEAQKKIKELRRQNLELLDSIQKKELFSQQAGGHFAKGLGYHLIGDLKAEVKAKEQVIQNLVKVNNEFADRLSILQSEKITMLNTKKACEDMFVYFNQKATEIFLMHEKTNKIIAENNRLRRFIEQLFHENFGRQRDALGVISESNEEYAQLLDQVPQALITASSAGNFNPGTFRSIYQTNDFSALSKDKAAQKGKGQEPSSSLARPSKTEDQSSLSKADKNAFLNEIEGASKATSQKPRPVKDGKEAKDVRLDKQKLKDLGPDFLAKFNAVLMENYELRAALEVKDRGLTEINKDLIQYKRKIKMVAAIESKVERLVAQNMRVKSFMLEIHAAALGKTNESELKVQELGHNVDISSQLLDTFIENGKKMLQSKKNAEKKAFLLQAQVNNLTAAIEKLEKETGAEISGLKIVIKERESDIELLKDVKKQNERLSADLKARELEIERLNSDLDAFRSTMELLEKNIEILSRANNTDIDKLRDEIDQHKNRLNLQLDERGTMLTAKLSAEAEMQRAREQLVEAKKELQMREDQLVEARVKSEGLAKEKSELQDALKSRDLAYEKAKLEKESLESENKSLESDLKIVRSRLEEYLDKNTNFLAAERFKITQEANNLVEEKIAKLEAHVLEMQRNFGEQAFALEKKDRELADQQTKLQSKNKQLMQFNKYFAAMASSKNPNKVEISRMLGQNRDLLKEIDNLRFKYNQLQSLYDNLQRAIERQSGSPVSEFRNVDGRLSLAKSVVDEQVADFATRAKVDAIMNLYEEKIALKDAELLRAKNQVVLLENMAKKAEESCLELKVQNEDLSGENEGLKQQITNLLIEVKTCKHLIAELKTRNKMLSDQAALARGSRIAESRIEGNKSALMESQMVKPQEGAFKKDKEKTSVILSERFVMED